MVCSTEIRMQGIATMPDIRPGSSITLMMIQITQETGTAPFAVVMNSNRNRRDSEHDHADGDSHTVFVQRSLLRYFPVAVRVLQAGVLESMAVRWAEYPSPRLLPA